MAAVNKMPIDFIFAVGTKVVKRATTDGKRLSSRGDARDEMAEAHYQAPCS